MRHPQIRDISSMNSGAFSKSCSGLERLTDKTQRLVDIVANENRVTRPEAWRLTAEETGLSHGTIENLDRERVKEVRVRVRDLIIATLIRKHQNAIKEAREQITKIIREAEAEIQIAKLTCSPCNQMELTAAETKLSEALAEAKLLISPSSEEEVR